MTFSDERLIRKLAQDNHCAAEAVRHGYQMADMTEDTPQLYTLIFYLVHPDQIEGWEGDPRTREQKDLDEFTNEVIDTRKSDYPI
jgi:hypothetical protein